MWQVVNKVDLKYNSRLVTVPWYMTGCTGVDPNHAVLHEVVSTKFTCHGDK